MTRHRESIDETIDRVAAALTMVPADSALAARIAERIDTHGSTAFAWPRLALGAAAIAVVAIVAAAVFSDQGDVAPREDVRVTEMAPPAEEPRTTAPTVAAPVGQVTQAARARRPRSVEHAPLPAIPQIDALPSPALLAVDTLPTNTLTIAPVDLEPLNLANLAVSEIDARDEPKE
jgi:hypothetical protein